MPSSTHQTITYRAYKTFNEDNFVSELQYAPWDVITPFDDSGDVLDT